MSWITSTTTNSAGALYFKVLQPAPALRQWVRYYWVLKDEARAPQIDEFLAPDGFEEIIFSYADGFRRTEVCGSETQASVLERSYVVGCKPYGVTCSRTGRLSMIGIKLWPQVLHNVLKVPLHQLAGRPLLLSDVNSHVLNNVEARLFDAASEVEIRRTLDTALQQMIQCEARDLLSHSVRQLFQSQGAVGIGELVGEAGVHYRTLEKSFRERVGLPPKTLAKIVRFKHAFESLSRGVSGRAAVTDFGYYDQAHFSKEFKLFTGRTPTQFFRDRLSIDVARFCLALDLQTLNQRSVPAELRL